MKKTISVLLTAVLVMSMMLVTSCGKSEFGLSENTEKLMTINAENAAKDDFFMTGTLEVADGEKVVVTSNLEKGSVKVELFATPEEQSIDEVPDVEEGEPVFMMNATGTDCQSGTMPAGSLILKATVLEKATGTVTIEVLPAE